jgi:hypothetical protein
MFFFHIKIKAERNRWKARNEKKHYYYYLYYNLYINHNINI